MFPIKFLKVKMMKPECIFSKILSTKLIFNYLCSLLLNTSDSSQKKDTAIFVKHKADIQATFVNTKRNYFHKQARTDKSWLQLSAQKALL
jgi:hypothetical protein